MSAALLVPPPPLVFPGKRIWGTSGHANPVIRIMETVAEIGVRVQLMAGTYTHLDSAEHVHERCRQEDPDCLSASPWAWPGYICMECRTVVIPAWLATEDPNRTPNRTREVSRLIHEVAHVVCQNWEEDPLVPWEHYAAMRIFGMDSPQVRDVSQYGVGSGLPRSTVRAALLLARAAVIADGQRDADPIRQQAYEILETFEPGLTSVQIAERVKSPLAEVEQSLAELALRGLVEENSVGKWR